MFDSGVDRVRSHWRELANAPAGYSETDVVFASGNSSWVAPPGWVGVVEIHSQVVVVSPRAQANTVRSALRRSAPDQLIDPGHIARLLNPAQTLGPAALFYGKPAEVQPQSRVVGPLPTSEDRVRAVVADASDSERAESGIDETTSGVYLALDPHGAPGAVCGWSLWPHGVAHICSLTAGSQRSQGLGHDAALVAVREASTQGLLPQWRAREGNISSVRLAQSLGLQRLAHQFSFLLT